jgi:acyl carrier protein
MNSREKLDSLEELLQVEKGSLAPETKLAEVEAWDSMAALALIVWLEENYGKTTSGSEIRAMKTVADILRLTER